MPTCPVHDRQLNVVELFSGIGGVSYAFANLQLPHSPDVTAFDINHVANAVHSFNLPNKKILTRNLSGITAADVDAYAADVWTMSPPCQPFTRYLHVRQRCKYKDLFVSDSDCKKTLTTIGQTVS